MNRSRAWPLVVMVLFGSSAPAPASAQTMGEVINGLFIFSSNGQPLFLAGSAGVPATAVHGDHFIPAAAESNGALLGVFTNAIADNIASFPLSSTVSSQTFSFVGGVPTPTSRSFGPIFAERAQTMGRGRFDVGFSYSSIGFDRIRGIPMSDVGLTFVHQNVDFPNCDVIFSGDCTALGVPVFEHDVIELGLDLRILAEIYAFNATLGVFDWLDLGVAVPVVQLDIDGRSRATIRPAEIANAAHFFGGDPASPDFTATGSSRGSTQGVGDVAVRTKVRVSDSEQMGVAVLAEVRLPTGRREDFLGAGELSARGMFIASATLGDFAPHVNFGYISRGASQAADGFLFAGGFDQRLSDWATFAVDLLGEFKTGDSLRFPDALVFDPPLVQTVPRSNVPNRRDDIIDGSVGLKIRTQGGVVLWGNALLALNDGGMRAGIVSSFGMQYTTR